MRYISCCLNMVVSQRYSEVVFESIKFLNFYCLLNIIQIYNLFFEYKNLTTMPPKYQLKARFLDCVLEDDMEGQLPTARIGCFVQYGGQFLDVLMIAEGAHTIKPDSMMLGLPDLPGIADPRVVFIIKDIQDDEPYVGSVSIARSILLEGKPDVPHQMWVTLFDDQGDDEYDGALGLDDDEDPRVQLEFTVTQIPEATAVASKPVEQVAQKKSLPLEQPKP